MEPVLKVSVSKTKKHLSFSFDEENSLELDIEDGQIDLIKLDEWITGILKGEWEKANLKIKLTGGIPRKMGLL